MPEGPPQTGKIHDCRVNEGTRPRAKSKGRPEGGPDKRRRCEEPTSAPARLTRCALSTCRRGCRDVALV